MPYTVHTQGTAAAWRKAAAGTVEYKPALDAGIMVSNTHTHTHTHAYTHMHTHKETLSYGEDGCYIILLIMYSDHLPEIQITR